MFGGKKTFTSEEQEKQKKLEQVAQPLADAFKLDLSVVLRLIGQIQRNAGNLVRSFGASVEVGGDKKGAVDAGAEGGGASGSGSGENKKKMMKKFEKIGCSLSVIMGYCNHDCDPNAKIEISERDGEEMMVMGI
jgi:hypothetical protein